MHVQTGAPVDLAAASLQRIILQRREQGIRYSPMFEPTSTMASHADGSYYSQPPVSGSAKYRVVTPDRSEIPLVADTPGGIHRQINLWTTWIEMAMLSELDVRGDLRYA